MDKLQHYIHKIRNLLKMTFVRVLLFVLLGIIMYATMFSNVRPEKLELSLFSVAEQTIRSPVTIEDKESTEKKKKEAENQVEDVYVVKKEIAQNRVDLITSIFDTVSEVNEDATEENKQASEKAKESEKDEKPKLVSLDEKLERTKSQLTEEVTKEISDTVLITLLEASPNQLSIAKDVTITEINHVMQQRIPADGVENAKKRVQDQISLTSLNNTLKTAMIELGRYAIYQNEFYAPEETQEKRQTAVESVEPVKILQGQILVEQNQLISREVYRQLELVGMLDSENSIQPFIGLALVVLIILAATYYYFYELDKPQEAKQNFLLSIVLFSSFPYYL